jgi:hypothetical protein
MKPAARPQSLQTASMPQAGKVGGASMNLNTGWIELNNSLKTLNDNWEEAKNYWKDTVTEEFEESFLHPLELQIKATLRGIERLTPALLKLQQDCG